MPLLLAAIGHLVTVRLSRGAARSIATPAASGGDAGLPLLLLTSALVAACLPTPPGPSSQLNPDGSITLLDGGPVLLPDGGLLPVTVTLEEYCSTIRGASCAQLEACGYYQDRRACESAVAGDACLFQRVALDAGRQVFDGALARQCLALALRPDCAPPEPPLPSCDAVFHGVVRAGEACWSSGDCAGEAFCATDGLVCPGVCTARIAEARVALGASCAPIAPATTMQVCVDGATCSGGICRRYTSLGAPCGGDDVCYLSECVAGLCTRLAKAGEACSRDASRRRACSVDTRCLSPDGGSDGTCLTPAPVGATCTQAAECLSGLCEQGACIERKSLGARCVGSTECRPELYCTGSPKVCTARLTQGQSCASAVGGCDRSLWCNPDTLLCAAPLALGAPCTNNTPCGPDRRCNSGRCELRSCVTVENAP